MSQLAVQGAVLVLMLLALPLTSAGSSTGTPWLSVLGLALIGIGSLVPPALRLRGPDEGEDA